MGAPQFLPPDEGVRERCVRVRNFVAHIETLAPYLTAEEMGDAVAFVTAQAIKHADLDEERKRRRDVERYFEERQLALTGDRFAQARQRREP